MHPDIVLLDCAGELVDSRSYIMLKCHLIVAFLDKVVVFFLPQVYFSTVFFP